MRVRGEQGQAVAAVVLVLLAVVVAAVVVAGAGGRLVDHARARTAADGAALAGRAAGRASAEAVAAANGGVVVRWREVGAEVEVTVRVGRATSTARAGWTVTAGR